ncbi:hypothetical protein ATY81_16950 [Rhizobium sp. R72]|uniref:DUF2231 domain-containing protein n=1 Tax=unclassified Rhizobium TaxID=2613769 RepID=UPI000B532696|nr:MULTISPECIES: DUF2231 domain-containing protein [unclassified Rhizobium]OWV92832.1 hypothetical protein ATY81_16950 [Rhizobium sp. R72]OWV93043.1 hypothetical protein ATY80_16950 [Rhizobium sp. R711]
MARLSVVPAGPAPLALSSVPLHFCAACLIGALLTDIVYWQTAEMTWANFSVWLLTAGVLVGIVAAVTVVIDVVRNVIDLGLSVSWIYLACLTIAFILSLLNVFIHSRDAWTSVVPSGLALSAFTAAAIAVAALCGAIAKHRRSEDWFT